MRVKLTLIAAPKQAVFVPQTNSQSESRDSSADVVCLLPSCFCLTAIIALQLLRPVQ